MNMNKLKKFLSVTLAALLLTASLLMSLPVSAADPYAGISGTTLNVYNWGEYISEGDEGSMDVIAEFEKLTGVKVNYSIYESNENMYNKLKGGGVSYDIVIPSDYMIERLIAEGMLEKIDYSNIPNYKYIAPEYCNMYYDPANEYSVPYNVGTVILIYNTKVVKEKPDSWGVLWDEQYKDQILMFNNPRDSFAIAQAYLGLDFNSTDEAQWRLAADKLIEQKPLVKGYVMDEVFTKMESGEAALAPYYAGDYEIMKENNPDLDFAFPKEGVNLFVDGMCIPKGAKNKKAAEAFINFMLEPETALANAETIGYASPNTAVWEMEDYSLKDSEAVYPDMSKIKTQYFLNLPPETQTYMTNLWGDVKNSGGSSTNLYVFFGIVGVAALTGIIISKRIKAKKAVIQDV